MLRRAAEATRALGLDPVLGPHAARRSRFLAGADDERLSDLHWAFSDSSVKGVISIRGGYGTIRLLPHVDWSLVRRHPKVFVGMSDVTAFQAAALRCDVVTFAGPMPAFGRQARLTQWAASGFWAAVGEGGPGVTISHAPGDPAPVVIRGGRARGALVGGNLATLVSLMGTPWELQLRQRIVILEDVGEAPYRVDRMLTQLILSGRFEDVAGVACGRFHECYKLSEREIIDVIAERIGSLGIPTVYGLAVGHQRDIATWPQGCRAELDADNHVLRLLQPGVV